MKKFFKFLVCAFMFFLYGIGTNAQNPYPNTGSHSVCEGETRNYGVVLTTGSTYVWSVTAGASGTDWVLTSPLEGEINKATVEWKKRGTYTVSVTETSANGCEGDPVTIAVTVNPLPIVSNKTASVCSGANIGIELPLIDEYTGVEGAVTITHYEIAAVKSTTTDFAGTPYETAAKTVAAEDMISDDVFTNTSGVDQTVTYTITPYAGDCAGENFTAIATVYPQPVKTAMSETAVCSRDVVGVTLPGTDNSTTPMTISKWRITSIDATDLVADAGNFSNLNTVITTANSLAADKFTNTTNSVKNVVYTVVPISANDCEGDPFTITVPVNPEPVITPVPQSSCSGEAIAQTLPTIGTNGVAIDKWDIVSITLSSTDPDVLRPGSSNVVAANNVASDYIASDVFTNLSDQAQTVTYRIQPYATTGGCAGDPYDLVVTITQAPVVEPQTANQCSGIAIGGTLPTTDKYDAGISSYYITDIVIDPSLTGSSAVTPTPTPVVGQDEVTATALAGDTYTNITNSAKTVVYTVIPRSTCNGEPFTYTVTINPEPVVGDGTGTACSADANLTTVDPVVAPTSVAVATYTITAVTPAGALVADATNADHVDDAVAYTTLDALKAAINADIFTNETDDDLTVVYTVVPRSAEGCAGETFTVTNTIYKKVVTSEISFE